MDCAKANIMATMIVAMIFASCYKHLVFMNWLRIDQNDNFLKYDQKVTMNYK